MCWKTAWRSKGIGWAMVRWGLNLRGATLTPAAGPRAKPPSHGWRQVSRGLPLHTWGKRVAPGIRPPSQLPEDTVEAPHDSSPGQVGLGHLGHYGVVWV